MSANTKAKAPKRVHHTTGPVNLGRVFIMLPQLLFAHAYAI